MIDYWSLVRDFAPGDIVQAVIVGNGIAPYVGRVTAVFPGLGVLDVQWPFGNERVSPEDIVKVNPRMSPYLPPTLTFGYYPGLAKNACENTPWRTFEVPEGFHLELAKVFHRGASELVAYDEIWHRYGSVDDAILKDEVALFYRVGSNLMSAFLQSFAKRTAIYWTAQNRQHRATKNEVTGGRPNCPRCGNSMRKTTYKMADGQRMRLFACPKDLYLIKESDILGPDGEPVPW